MNKTWTKLPNKNGKQSLYDICSYLHWGTFGKLHLYAATLFSPEFQIFHKFLVKEFLFGIAMPPFATPPRDPALSAIAWLRHKRLPHGPLLLHCPGRRYSQPVKQCQAPKNFQQFSTLSQRQHHITIPMISVSWLRLLVCFRHAHRKDFKHTNGSKHLRAAEALRIALILEGTVANSQWQQMHWQPSKLSLYSWTCHTRICWLNNLITECS